MCSPCFSRGTRCQRCPCRSRARRCSCRAARPPCPTPRAPAASASHPAPPSLRRLRKVPSFELVPRSPRFSAFHRLTSAGAAGRYVFLRQVPPGAPSIESRGRRRRPDPSVARRAHKQPCLCCLPKVSHNHAPAPAAQRRPTGGWWDGGVPSPVSTPYTCSNTLRSGPGAVECAAVATERSVFNVLLVTRARKKADPIATWTRHVADRVRPSPTSRFAGNRRRPRHHRPRRSTAKHLHSQSSRISFAHIVARR